MSESGKASAARLRIGAVSRLTGLSVHALRKWEQRYGAVEPVRTEGGERLYSREDVERLSLIRRLSTAGFPLAEMARWTLERLRGAADEAFGIAAPDGGVSGPARPVRVALCGASLPARLQAGFAASASLALAAGAPSLEALAEALEGQPVDVVVCELPTVTEGSVRAMRRAVSACGARRGIVACGFGSRASLDALRQAGFAVLREPVDVDALERALVAPGGARGGAEGEPQAPPPIADGAGVPAARFSPETVARVASMPPALRCECPQHLAQILFTLRAFEQYSAECEDANPDDAALHRYLGATAGRARAAFEEALARVAEAEGIALDG